MWADMVRTEALNVLLWFFPLTDFSLTRRICLRSPLPLQPGSPNIHFGTALFEMVIHYMSRDVYDWEVQGTIWAGNVHWRDQQMHSMQALREMSSLRCWYRWKKVHWVHPGFFQYLEFREMRWSQQGYGDGAERQANNHASKESWGPSGEWAWSWMRIQGYCGVGRGLLASLF